MAIENFKRVLWEGALLANFHDVSIADVITTKPTSVNGSKVVFNRVGSANLKDYTGTINWDEVVTTPVELPFNQKKYFAITVDDVDKVQLVADVMKDTVKEHSDVLSEVIDNYILTQATKGVKAANKIGSVATQELVTVSNVYDYIVDLGTKLNKAKCPKTDRFVMINSDILGLLTKDDRFTRNPDVLANGIVNGQKINGMQVVLTEEVPTGTVVALHKSALGYAKQLDEIEAMRLQSSFADGVRCLCVYDSVVLRDDAIAVLNYKLS